MLAVLVACLSLVASPSVAGASDPATTTTPAIAPTYEAVCAPVPAPFARCASLRRTDAGARPALRSVTTADGSAVPELVPGGYGPADLRSAYGLPASGGNGRTVAIVDAFDLATAEADMATYRSTFGLPACSAASGCFRRVDQRGGKTYPVTSVGLGWDSEMELDLDMVSAVCPDCRILLVEADNAISSSLATGADTAVRLGAVAVSNSYTAVEFSGETALQDPLYNHPGVVVTAATGDLGYQAGVAYPAASPYVVAVGGTSLQHAGNARGWTETVWSNSPTQGTGSGCSAYEPKPYWQTDSGCVDKTTADISAVADPSTGVDVYDPNHGGWNIYGGTSASTPIVAAAAVLAGNPAAGSYPSRLLYSRAANLWDVTSGSDGTCGGSYLCTAAAGYDGPTGLGTPNGTAALAPDVLDVGAGTRTSCAITSDGTLSCWGYNGAGEASAPAGTYAALSTGDSHSCAIDTAGTLHCWGGNGHGESSPPAGSYVTVSAGSVNSCAIDTSGALHCWGDNSHGVTSPPAGTYSAVAVGGLHACAIDSTKALQCWGDNGHGQASAPAGSYIAVAAGQNHTCALTSAATIACWGDNSQAQRNNPSGSFIDIAAGGNGSCALGLAGSVQCWGDNGQGQNSGPGTAAARVARGTSNGCAYLGSGVACWGGNADGQTVPLFATTSIPAAVPGGAYATDIALATAVVPAPTFAVSSGSLPSGVTLSPTGHLSGTPATPGTYPFVVTAGNGIAPAASQSLTLVVAAPPPPPTPPGAPTAVVATAGDASAAVTWAAPASDGGAAIGGYTVTSSPDGATCTTGGSIGCTVTGLANGTAYTFTVTATNSAGAGPASDPSNSVTPGPGPGAPTSLVAIASNTSAVVTWAAPASDGGTAIQGYTVTSSPPATGCAMTLAMTCTMSGLTNHTTYTFSVAATNASSTGPAASVAATPLAGATYIPLIPNRLVDSRAGTRLGLSASLRSGVPASFKVTDRWTSDASRNVPANAIAVTANLTVTSQSSKGYLALTPQNPGGTPSTSTLNFPKGDNRANALTIPLGGGNLWVTFVGTAGATADVIFDVTGYFVPNSTGASYVALTPNRLVDSRAAARIGLSSSLTSRMPATFTVVGRSSDPNLLVPSGAVAVTANLTVTSQSSKGYLALTPQNPGGTPSTSMLNFPLGDNRANALTVALNPAGTVWVTFVGTVGARADVIFDVTGYFAP